MDGLTYILLFGIAPLVCAYYLAKSRNRTVWKAILATLVFGWLAVILMLLFMKTRTLEGYLK